MSERSPQAPNLHHISGPLVMGVGFDKCTWTRDEAVEVVLVSVTASPEAGGGFGRYPANCLIGKEVWVRSYNYLGDHIESSG